ncbi:MAG: hypothetical protein EA378_06120 [Phycisphaerales bacterium]|nr:MAG: hypothetical protein EA378_06120 [Phycisphaerales bacterium]
MPTDRASARANEPIAGDPPALTKPPPSFALWARPWGPTLALIGAVLAARLIFLACFSPYALVEDEAHYWEWARNLDWSYYSKGPGVAWTIAAGWALTGEARFVGLEPEFGVRVLAPVFAAMLSLCVAALARDAFDDGRVAFAAAAVTCLVPVFQVLAFLMTIDGPFAAFWALAALAAWKAIVRGGEGWWAVFGLAVAGSFLFKYTALLIVPGVIAFALLRARLSRAGLVEPGRVRPAPMLAGSALMLLGLVPVLVWNAQNEWVTVRHLMGHLGLPGGDRPSAEIAQRSYAPNPLFTLEFLALQLAIVGPALVLMIYGYRRTWRGSPHQPAARGERAAAVFCLCIGAPVILFYLAISPWVRVEGNWTLAGYVSLAALAGWAAVDGMDVRRRRVRDWRALPDPRPRAGIFRRTPEAHRQVAWHATLWIGLVVGLLMLRVDLLARLPVLDRLIPVGRLESGERLSADVAQRLDELRERGSEAPFAIAQHYGRASQLAFYLPGRPVVYCASSHMAGRDTQYDVFPHTDLRRASVFERLRGRDAVALGGTGEQWATAFERVEAIDPLPGDHKQREAFLLFNYRGFPTGAHEPPHAGGTRRDRGGS